MRLLPEDDLDRGAKIGLEVRVFLVRIVEAQRQRDELGRARNGGKHFHQLAQLEAVYRIVHHSPGWSHQRNALRGRDLDRVSGADAIAVQIHRQLRRGFGRLCRLGLSVFVATTTASCQTDR